jgi:hypothetical protein
LEPAHRKAAAAAIRILGLLAGCGPLGIASAPAAAAGIADLFDESWTVLRRPNSAWSVGDILDVAETLRTRGDPRVIGNFGALCLPTEVWQVRIGQGEGLGVQQAANYKFDIGASIASTKVGDAKAAMDALNKSSNRLRFQKYQEDTADVARIDNWLTSKNSAGKPNVESLSFACKGYFLAKNYRIIGSAFRVFDAEVSYTNQKGGKFDLNFRNSLLAALDLSANFTVDLNDAGELLIKQRGDKPITLAVREYDFSRLYRLFVENPKAFGIDTAPPISKTPLKQVLEQAGLGQ